MSEKFIFKKLNIENVSLESLTLKPLFTIGLFLILFGLIIFAFRDIFAVIFSSLFIFLGALLIFQGLKALVIIPSKKAKFNKTEIVDWIKSYEIKFETI